MKRAFLLLPVLVIGGLAGLLTVSSPEAEAGDSPTPLELLQAGNERYAHGEPRHVHQGLERRSVVARGQEPFAVVIGCADSRVPPEILFDQGLGDLFVIRCAGGVVEDAAIGSIEYAVEHLGTALVVVLGHERCGAVGAVVESTDLPAHLSAFVPTIEPVLAEARRKGGDVVDNAVRATALRIADQLRQCPPVLAELVHEGKLEIVAARYDLDTGNVEWLDAPAQGAPAAHH